MLDFYRTPAGRKFFEVHLPLCQIFQRKQTAQFACTADQLFSNVTFVKPFIGGIDGFFSRST